MKRGKYISCVNCNSTVYRAPSQLVYKKAFCSSVCRSKYAFNFPCKVCGLAIYTQPAQLKYRARSTCSPRCRAHLARLRAEERRKIYTKHQLDRLARYSNEAKEWRKNVFARDNYTCSWCYIRGTYLEADHIKPWAYFPELRYELSNGRTLCRNCHKKTKVGAKAMRELYPQDDRKG